MSSWSLSHRLRNSKVFKRWLMFTRSAWIFCRICITESVSEPPWLIWTSIAFKRCSMFCSIFNTRSICDAVPSNVVPSAVEAATSTVAMMLAATSREQTLYVLASRLSWKLSGDWTQMLVQRREITSEVCS